jgi:hypothetical protein
LPGRARCRSRYPCRDTRRVPCRQDLNGVGRRRELERVLEHVDEHALDLRRVGADDLRITIDGDNDARCLHPELLERALDEQIDRPGLGPAKRRAGLEAREVEQVVDEALESPDLDPDRLEELVPVGIGELERREALARRADCRQRRAQVVADRAENRRLRSVALAERLRLDRLLRQPPRSRRQLAHDDSGGDVDAERDPVL